MSKFLKSVSSSSAPYSRSLDMSASRGMGTREYGPLGPLGQYEAASSSSPSVPLSVPLSVSRKLQMLQFGSRHRQDKTLQLGESIKPAQQGSGTVLSRVRDAYERVMRKVGSKSGELSVVPVAKASTAPPTLAKAFGSRHGSKVSDIDPGFKMTTAEKKYMAHLKRTASSGRF